MEAQKIIYSFKFNGGNSKNFELELDKDLNLRVIPNEKYPEWCELYFYKCSICTLDDEKNEYCSAAIAVFDIFNFFANIKSYERVDVKVETSERTYFKNVSMQKAISSIIGIAMASSSCPILSRLKPFVKQHLPFATSEETISRIISFYLLAQFYKSNKGQIPDWNLEALKKIYDEIRIVNKSFFQRVKNSFPEDADTNAITILESFANSINFSLDGIMKNDFQEILLKSF